MLVSIAESLEKQNKTLSEINESLKVLLNLYSPRFVFRASEASLELAKKLGKSKPGSIIFVTSDEMAELGKMQIISPEVEK